jgi:hypothetical protein
MRRYVLSLALIPALGCVGSIGDAGSEGQGGASQNDSGSESSSSGSSSGASSGGNPGPCVDVLPARRVWTLSRTEYDNSVAAVLGNTSKQAQTTFPAEDRATGFVDNAQAEVVTSALITPMMTAAETIAAQSVTGELTFITSTLSCTLVPNPTLASPDPCAVQYINTRGAAFFRRPLTADETTDLYATYVTGFNNPFAGASGTTSAVENVVATLLQMPQFFYRTELGSPGDTSSPVQMTQYEIASAIAFMATGNPPDATLLAAANAGTVSTPAAISAQYQRLMSTPGGHAQMEEFVLQGLAEDQIAALGTSTGPVTPSIAAEMLTEAKSFVEEAVFNGTGTVNELLTGGYTFANADLAAFYGLPAVSSSNFTKVALAPTSGRAGLLSQGAFLISNSQTGVPLLHRGHMIRQQLLCETLPSFASVGLPGFTPPPFDTPPHGTTTRQALTASIVGVCLTCHHYFMPIGFGLENFDPFARYQTTQNGGAVDPSGAIFDPASIDPASGTILTPASYTETAFNDYSGLASTLAADPRTSMCFANHVASYVSGQGIGLNECVVQTTQTPPTGLSSATVQQQFLNYAQSKNFVWRTR